MIGLIDYGCGNIRSLVNLLEKMNFSYNRTSEISVLDTCDILLLPGVGRASFAMHQLENLNLIDFIKNTKKPTFCICVGLQLLTEFSEEDATQCLGVLPSNSILFPNNTPHNVPHMGWNHVQFSQKRMSKFNNQYFYFVHSYYVEQNKFTCGTTNYCNLNFSSIVEIDNFFGVQFHPEKSGTIGEIFFFETLKNLYERV